MSDAVTDPFNVDSWAWVLENEPENITWKGLATVAQIIRQLEAERDTAYRRGLESAADRLRAMGDMDGMKIIRALEQNGTRTRN